MTVVFTLESLMLNEDGSNDWWLDGVFATPELAMEYVPLALNENASGKWRRCNIGRRWVSPLPKRYRRGVGSTSAWVIDETEIATSNDWHSAPLLPLA